jgi:hypothetical protein
VEVARGVAGHGEVLAVDEVEMAGFAEGDEVGGGLGAAV